MGASKRRRGVEFRAAGWMARHPNFAVVPAGVTTAVTQVGAVSSAAVLGGAATALAAWWRADPDSFDQYAAPVLRAQRRRWINYVGNKWNDIFDSCGLVRENSKKGITEVPKLLKVRSTTPTIDVLTVKMTRGQSIRKFQAQGEELAQSLNAESLGIIPVKDKPKHVQLVVVRENPFDELIEAAEIPEHADEVDLKAIPIGESEYGDEMTIPILGQQILGGGASGAGKGGLISNPLRALGPAIRQGTVKVSGVDGKGGMELEQYSPLFEGRLACQPDEYVPLLREYLERMRFRKKAMAGVSRKVDISEEMPLELLIIDELGMLTAYGDSDTAKEIIKILAEILTQGRALGFTVMAFLQDPSKDVIPLRDLFTYRICLRTTTANQVNMLLGDNMREKGALADLIYPDESTAGIGFVRSEKAAAPARFRCGWNSDAEIRELVSECTPTPKTLDESTVTSIRETAPAAPRMGPEAEQLHLEGDGEDFDDDLDDMPTPTIPTFGDFEGRGETEVLPAITEAMEAVIAARREQLSPPF